MKLVKSALFLSLFYSLLAYSHSSNDSTSNIKPTSAIPGLSRALQACDQQYKENPSKSMSCYQKLALDKPGTIDAYLSLVRFYGEENPQESIGYAKKGLEVAGISPEEKARLYRGIAAANNQLKNFQGSIDAAESGLKIPGISLGQQLDFYARIGEIKLNLNDFAGAIKAAQSGVDLQAGDDQKKASLYNVLGYSQYRMGDLGSAEKSLKKAIKLDSALELPYYNLSFVYGSKVSNKNTAAQNNHFQALQFYYKGLGHQVEKKILAARANFEMSLQAEPNNQEVVKALSELPKLNRSIPPEDLNGVEFEVPQNQQVCDEKAVQVQKLFDGEKNVIGWMSPSSQARVKDVGAVNELGYTALYGPGAYFVSLDSSPVGLLMTMAAQRKGSRENNAFGLKIKAQSIEKDSPCLFTVGFDGYQAKNVFFTTSIKK